MKFRKSLSVMLAAAMLTAAVPSAVMAESSVAENAEVMSDIELCPRLTLNPARSRWRKPKRRNRRS